MPSGGSPRVGAAVAVAAAAAVAGVFFVPWDRPRKARISNVLGCNRSKVSRTWVEHKGFHIKISRSRPSFMSKKHESGQLGA